MTVCILPEFCEEGNQSLQSPDSRAKHTKDYLRVRMSYHKSNKCFLCQFAVSFLKVKVYHVVASCASDRSTQCHVSLPTLRLRRAVRAPKTYRCQHNHAPRRLIETQRSKQLHSCGGGVLWEKHFSEIFPVRKHTQLDARQGCFRNHAQQGASAA